MTEPPSDNPFQYARRRDPIGDRVHLVLAGLLIAAVPLGTSAVAISSGIAGGYALLRIWATARCYLLLFGPPLMTLLFALTIWLVLSLAWSPDLAQGLDEIRILRFWIVVPFVLWPMIHRLDWLLCSLLLGAFILTLVQLAQLAGWEIGTFDPTVPNRFPGFGHPSQAAVVQVTAGIIAMGLAILGNGWWRAVGAVMVLSAASGLVLTFSRGPWIAALIAWPVAAVWLVVVARVRGTLRGRMIVLGAFVVLIGGAGVVLSLGDRIGDRIRVAQEEIRLALVEDEYRTNVGARIRQIEASWMIAKARPWFGVGAGGYVTEARRLTRPDEVLPPDLNSTGSHRHPSPVLPHPHSAPLYYLVTGGFPALVVYLAIWGVLFVGLVRRARSCQGFLGPTVPAAGVGLFVAYLVDSQNLSDAGTILFMVLATAAVPVSGAMWNIHAIEGRVSE